MSKDATQADALLEVLLSFTNKAHILYHVYIRKAQEDIVARENEISAEKVTHCPQRIDLTLAHDARAFLAFCESYDQLKRGKFSPSNGFCSCFHLCIHLMVI